MANARITELPTATAPTGAELMEIVQGGINKKLTLNEVVALLNIYILDLVDDVDTSGGTITLDLNSQVQRMFVGATSFATPKTIALSNTTNGLVIDFKFNLTNVAAVLTFPSDFVMVDTDNRWNNTPPKTFTATILGRYEFSATYDPVSSLWDLKVTNQFPSS